MTTLPILISPFLSLDPPVPAVRVVDERKNALKDADRAMLGRMSISPPDEQARHANHDPQQEGVIRG
jgi:hypothetical protein